jgi:predicted PurR-regulated permease PerM
MALSVRTQIIAWGAAAVVFFLLLWQMGGVLLPFLVGGAMAYFLDPVADRLQRMGLSRSFATFAIMLGTLLVLVLVALSVVPLLYQQLRGLIDATPAFVKQLEDAVLLRFPELADNTSTMSQTLSQIAALVQSKGGELAKGVLDSAFGLIGGIVFLLVVPVVAFYLLLDWDHMVARIDALLPRDHAPTIRKLGQEMNAVLSAFVRGQMSVCLIMAMYYSGGLMLGGLQFGLLVGVVAGTVTFIPYLGALIGGALGISLALVQFWGDWVSVAIVVAVIAFGQFIEGNIITPRLVGKSVGLHPVWLLFALSAMGTLFGFVGLLVAVPVAASLGVVTRFMVDRYKASLLYQGQAEAEGAATPRDTDEASA